MNKIGQRRWNADYDKRLIALDSAGLLIKEIAAELGFCPDHISIKREILGLPSRRNKYRMRGTTIHVSHEMFIELQNAAALAKKPVPRYARDVLRAELERNKPDGKETNSDRPNRKRATELAGHRATVQEWRDAFKQAAK